MLKPEISLIDSKEVCKLTGYSRSGLYRIMKRGDFPLPIKIGTRANRWKLAEIQNFIESRARVVELGTKKKPGY